jgi:site-specific recombinase XerD
MSTKIENQPIIHKAGEDNLHAWIEAFLLDKRSQKLSTHTLKYYSVDLAKFSRFCEINSISAINQITPDILRRFMLWMEETGHNAGGIHGHYRAVRAFMLWYEQESEPENWRNPIHKVKAPKLDKEILEPISMEAVSAMVDTCGADFYGIRDKALILILLDTGARASEICSINLKDIDTASGTVFIKHGKGRKSRIVYIGRRTRKALRAYLRARNDANEALFIGRTGERLAYFGLAQMIQRRADLAKMTPQPSCHSFRRAFALNCLRAGMNVYALKELMGHEDLQVLQRYLKITELDTEISHRQFAPVDNMLK